MEVMKISTQIKNICICFYCEAETYEQGGLQEVQLEDGSTAYIQHTVHMPQPNTILAIQADGTIADLQAEATAIDPETISVLEQYTTKVSEATPFCLSTLSRAKAQSTQTNF